jgi:hypothetical protein
MKLMNKSGIVGLSLIRGKDNSTDTQTILIHTNLGGQQEF